MTLAELQRQFKAVLHQPEDVEDLSSLGIRETPAFPRATRFEVYRYAYRARIEDSIIEDFPQTRKKLGEKAFSGWFQRYLTIQPSRFASLAEVSRDFPAFLRAQSQTEGDRLHRASELARYEWTRLLSELEEAPEPSNLGELPTLGPDDFPRLRFRLHPSTFFFSSDFKVNERLGRGTTRIAIHHIQRQEFRTSLTAPQWDMLQAIHAGKGLAELEALGFDPEISGEWFQQWTTSGLVHRFYLETP